MRKNTVLRVALGLVIVASAIAIVLPAATAQNDSNFGTVTLAPGFMPDPHTKNGTSGGNLQASSWNSSCAGWVTQRPDHIFNATKAFSTLRISATSPQDVTLVIQKPDGSYVCNDDSEGTNPAISGAFPAGRHKIWIGSYQQGQNAAYTISFTELAGGGTTATPTPTAGGTNGTSACGTSRSGRPLCIDAVARLPRSKQISLRSGFTPDPMRKPLTAGGGRDPINVRSLGLTDAVSGTACGDAWITPKPDFRVQFAAGSTFSFLRYYATTRDAAADATLLINTPNAQWRCDDDSGGGLNPMIDFQNPPPGQYDIWVGTYGGGARNPATLFITELNTNRP